MRSSSPTRSGCTTTIPLGRMRLPVGAAVPRQPLRRRHRPAPLSLEPRAGGAVFRRRAGRHRRATRRARSTATASTRARRASYKLGHSVFVDVREQGEGEAGRTASISRRYHTAVLRYGRRAPGRAASDRGPLDRKHLTASHDPPPPGARWPAQRAGGGGRGELDRSSSFVSLRLPPPPPGEDQGHPRARACRYVPSRRTHFEWKPSSSSARSTAASPGLPTMSA